MVTEITIETEFIALGQFLKLAGIIDTGGQVKWFLQEYEIHVNGQPENRRGKKLYSGDRIDITDVGSFKVVQSS